MQQTALAFSKRKAIAVMRLASSVKRSATVGSQVVTPQLMRRAVRRRCATKLANGVETLLGAGLVTAAAVLAVACEGLSEINCTQSIEPAIVVEVRHAETGAPAAADVAGAVRDGSYVDSLTVSGWEGPTVGAESAVEMSAAPERPGRYSMELMKPGFVAWSMEDVIVEDGICHVQTVHLRALLEPLT
jgi:hypothetical protein